MTMTDNSPNCSNIDLQDLMLNDLISYKGHIRKVNKDTPHYFETRKPLFYPIHITFDILEDLGFTLIDSDDTGLKYASKYFDLYPETNPNTKNFDIYRINDSNIKIQYIHQLQHILRLYEEYNKNETHIINELISIYY